MHSAAKAGGPRRRVGCIALVLFPRLVLLSILLWPSATAWAETHWAFAPLASTAESIDSLILERLTAAGLAQSPQADRVTLIRRLTLDLTGLPPRPEAVANFLQDDSPEAYEKVVDRLLASPAYGERWGRHWLDLARYADSGGYHNDLDRPHAWKYRDYVIRSFNEDKPFLRFVAEQIAGDEIEQPDETSLIATGFCRNGPSNDDNMGKTDAAIAQYRADQLDDVISTVSTVFLGVTIGCARCHDHKTDPFTAKDYYSLLAIFNGTEKYGLVPGTEDKNGKKVTTDPNIHVHALVETGPVVPPTHVMLRGNASNLGEEVPPAVPAVLAAQPINFPAPSAKTSLRRRTLAEWITSPENPLTWRVLANRVWQHHFGRGIVTTPSNFGLTGAPPTHPELLDYLAQRLLVHGGRLKPVHREILLSATYRQSCATNPEGLRIDPENRLLWRRNLQRMEAEVLRDSILFSSGRLNPRMGGPGTKPRIRPSLLPVSQRNKWSSLKADGPEQWRRSVYIYVKRQLLLPMMELFDAPSTNDSCALRSESTVPTQALVLMNDDFVEDQAVALAERASREAGEDLPTTVDRMFRLTWTRPPNRERLAEAMRFVAAQEAAGRERIEALADLAHVLFNASEFLYIE